MIPSPPPPLIAVLPDTAVTAVFVHLRRSACHRRQPAQPSPSSITVSLTGIRPLSIYISPSQPSSSTTVGRSATASNQNDRRRSYHRMGELEVEKHVNYIFSVEKIYVALEHMTLDIGHWTLDIGHDPHLLYTLSGIQVLALFDKMHILDIDKKYYLNSSDMEGSENKKVSSLDVPSLTASL
ncbi:hypothetical protein ACSBR1_007015 [Camellia fascicularis]